MHHNVLLVEATYDTIAPPDKMLKPLENCLKEANGKIYYESIKSNHSFVGQRMRLARIVGEWVEGKISDENCTCTDEK